MIRTNPAEVVPHIEQTAGVGTGTSWFYVAALLLGAVAFVLWALLAHAERRPQDTTPTTTTRPVYWCQAGRGPDKCPGRATRLVMLTLPTLTRLMCDSCASRHIRLGHAVDLGPIDGPTR